MKRIKIDNVKKEKSYFDKILSDRSKRSATKQAVVGISSGWITGYLALNVGKLAALALGGSIILLKIGYDKGYIKINWSKVQKRLYKASDQVERRVLGQDPNWADKMERYVDRELDKVEDLFKDNKKKAKRWYSSFLGNSDNALRESHIFIAAFMAGLAIAVVTS